MKNTQFFKRKLEYLKNRWVKFRQQPVVHVMSTTMKMYGRYRSVRRIGELLLYAQDHWGPHLLGALPDPCWRAYELIYPLIELAHWLLQ